MSGPAESVRPMPAGMPVLVRTGIYAAALLGLSLVGLAMDPRELGGAPLWLKPAKFGLSTSTYLLTLAWMTRDLPASRRLQRISAAIGWLIVLEDALIILQAARGTASHFNVDTPLDRVIFGVMGVSIATVWVLSMVLLVQHVRAPARDRAMAMAFRLGLALNIVGSAVGWIMVQPRPEQIAAMRAGVHPMRSGAHTVGAPDGGAGMPLTKWSTTHGDLRVPHFVGLHALQLLPLFVVLLRTVRTPRDDGMERSALTLVAGACFGFFFTTLLQALQGRPFLPGS